MLGDYMEAFRRMVKLSEPDGYGGLTDTWTDGDAFLAGIATDNSARMKIAEQNGQRIVYAIIASTAVGLVRGEVVKRTATGELYTITSDAWDMTTPAVAECQYAQVSAERVEV